MSLEADLVEVRKLCKAFSGLANVEAALSGAVSADASAKAALKRLESAEQDAKKHRSDSDRAKHDKKHTEAETLKLISDANTKAAVILADAEKKAADLVDTARKGVELAIVEKNTAIQNAKTIVDLAKADLISINKEITEATAKLSKIREAIAVVVGK